MLLVLLQNDGMLGTQTDVVATDTVELDAGESVSMGYFDFPDVNAKIVKTWLE